MMDYMQPQPPPINRDDEPDIADLVIADLVEKKRMGVAKYGVALRAHNGRSALVDLYQELLDAVQYLRQELREREEPADALEPLVVEATGDYDDGLPRITELPNVTRHVKQALIALRDAGIISFYTDEEMTS